MLDARHPCGVIGLVPATHLSALLEAGVPATTPDAVVEVNANARIEALRVSLAVLAVLAAIAIFMTRLLPTTPAGRRDHDPATD
jgi:hypothetical protein